MTKFNFLKAHGLGNDFAIFTEKINLNISVKLIKFICDRKVGIGCDLVVFLSESENNYSDIVSRFFNRDGTEAEICGNALRCIGKYYFKKFNKTNLTVETNSGLIDVEKHDNGNISVDLGKPNLKWNKIPINVDIDVRNLGLDFKYLRGGFALNIGNPHIIFFVDIINKKNLEADSIKILKKDLFPQGVNITVVEVVSNNKLNILTYERGVGITNACGSGAGASVFASYKSKYCARNVEVFMSGGNLNVEITKDEHILTIGEAIEVFEGRINLEEYLK